MYCISTSPLAPSDCRDFVYKLIVFIFEVVQLSGVQVETSNLLPMAIQALLMFVELVVVLVVAGLVRGGHDLEGCLHLLDFNPQLAQGLSSLSQVPLEAITLGITSQSLSLPTTEEKKRPFVVPS